MALTPEQQERKRELLLKKRQLLELKKDVIDGNAPIQGPTAPTAPEQFIEGVKPTGAPLDPFKKRSEELIEKAQVKFAEASSIFKGGRKPTFSERMGAIKTASKGALPLTGGLISKMTEDVIEITGIIGTKLGTEVEQFKGNLTDDQAQEVFDNIIESPEFFDQSEQNKADILNLALAFALPAFGASKVSTLAPFTGAGKGSLLGNFLSKIVGLSAVGAGSAGLGAVQLEGRAPTLKETMFGAILGPLGAGAPKILQKANKLRKSIFNIKEVSQKLDDVTTRIGQGKKADIAKNKEALQSIDTTDVKTYDDLADAATVREEALASKVDVELLKQPDIFHPRDLVIKDEFGKGTTDFTNRALDELEELYLKIGDDEGARIIQNNRKVFEASGATLKDYNDLARLHGQEFKTKAFNPRTGEPKTSIVAEKAENTRRGLKEAVRKEMPTETARILDEEASRVFNLDRLATKMSEKVNTLDQTVTKRGFMEKIARGVGRAIDILSFGSIRGFFTSFLPSNIGNKVNNSLDIEAALSSNIDEFNKLLKIEKEKDFISGIVKFIKKITPEGITPGKIGVEERVRIPTKAIIDEKEEETIDSTNQE